ncbi:MAG TPA: hypothetical protein VFH57_02670 [Gammaproteobacteria bacterium]|nr:hypothetical protein [Gammaproteobacteria bacterium]
MRRRIANLLLLGFMTCAFAAQAGDEALTVTARLSANDAVEGMLFGRNVVVEGNVIAVSALGSLASGARQPATFIFYRNPDDQWLQHQELPAGGALSLRSGVLLVGDAVYTRDDAAAFVRRARLQPTDAQADSGFGQAVALFDRGTRAAVGAPFETVDGVASAGAVYIFERISAGRWKQTARLVAPATATSRNFGMALAADGDTLVVGAPIAARDGSAAAYAFVDDGEAWTLQQAFTGRTGMGWSVALDGDTILIGTDGGPAYVFVRDQGHWSQQAALKPPTGLSGEFGFDLALAGDKAFIGFPPTQVSTFSAGATAAEPGRALLFTRRAGVWSETAATGPYEDSENLGVAVAIDNGTMLLADPQADANSYESAGLVYVLNSSQAVTDDGGSGMLGPAALGLLFAAAIPLVRKRRIRYLASS